jgi:hypothetical protein
MAEKTADQAKENEAKSKQPQAEKIGNELRISPKDAKSTFVSSSPKPTDPKVIPALHLIDAYAKKFQESYNKNNKIIIDLLEAERNEKKIDVNVIRKKAVYLASKMNEAGYTAEAGNLISGVNEQLRKNFKNQEIDNPYSNQG